MSMGMGMAGPQSNQPFQRSSPLSLAFEQGHCLPLPLPGLRCAGLGLCVCLFAVLAADWPTCLRRRWLSSPRSLPMLGTAMRVARRNTKASIHLLQYFYFYCTTAQLSFFSCPLAPSWPPLITSTCLLVRPEPHRPRALWCLSRGTAAHMYLGGAHLGRLAHVTSAGRAF